MQMFDSNNTQAVEDLMMAMVGMDSVAYIRPVASTQGTTYAVCAADGTELAVFDSMASAQITARWHNLEASVLH